MEYVVEHLVNQKLTTPCYVIDVEQFNKNIDDIQTEFKKSWGELVVLGYSIKTNHYPFFLKHAKQRGFLAEAVSGDEYEYAISQGYSPQEIIYNGPQKDRHTMRKAIFEGSIVNVDNFQDIKLLEDILPEVNDRERLKIGVRVNFDLERVCKGETNFKDGFSRFGISVENGDFERALRYLDKLGCPVRGLHFHYTTKTRSLSVFKAIANKANQLIRQYKLEHSLTYIDIGGGFWGGRKLPGKPTMKEYSQVIATELKKVVSPHQVQLILEPGSSLLATTVHYLTRVINIRDIQQTKVVTVDGSLLHINPFINHREPEFSTSNMEDRKVIPKQIISGSTCLEFDRILHLESYNEFRTGDLILIHNTGAYTMTLNNSFINCPPRIYVKEKAGFIKVREESIEIMARI